jgi:hypothetical protein
LWRPLLPGTARRVQSAAQRMRWRAWAQHAAVAGPAAPQSRPLGRGLGGVGGWGGGRRRTL